MIQTPCAFQFLSYIKSLPSPWVFEFFLLESDSTRKILSTNIIESAVSAFVEPQNIVDKFNALGSGNQLKCALIYLTGNAGFVCETEDPLEHPLVKSFLVFAATDQSGKARLFGFEEFESILRSICVATIHQRAQAENVIISSPQWKWRPLNDIVIVVSLASQGEIKRGRNGKFARTTLQKIKRLTEGSSGSASETGDYIARMMVSYCVSKEMLCEQEMEYVYNHEAYERWVELSLAERLEDCRNFVINYSGGWRIEMLQELLVTSGSTMNDLNIVPEKDRMSVFDSVRALRFAGLLEYNCIDNSILISSASQFESTDDIENTALVQADFSAVISQETDPGVLHTFAQLGEFVLLDKVYKGKIEKKILGNSLSRGVNSDEVLDWLGKRQAPPNVIETVREWIREFFRLYISDRTILVSGDEKVSRQLESFEPLRSQLEILHAHTVYQVKPGCEGSVKETLASLGFDYRKPGECCVDFGENTNNSADEDVTLTFESWKPVTDVKLEDKKKGGAIRGTKYGEELKALDMSEIIHVIDYAVLTGRNLTVDYEGSPYLKPGIYTILPFSCRKGIEPVLEAEMIKTKSRKQFYIKKIKKIGVAAE